MRGEQPRLCLSVVVIIVIYHHQHSVPNLDQVVGQRLDRLRGISDLRILAVVANQHGLRRLDDDNACPALWVKPRLADGVLLLGLGDVRSRTCRP